MENGLIVDVPMRPDELARFERLKTRRGKPGGEVLNEALYVHDRISQITRAGYDLAKIGHGHAVSVEFVQL